MQLKKKTEITNGISDRIIYLNMKGYSSFKIKKKWMVSDLESVQVILIFDRPVNKRFCLQDVHLNKQGDSGNESRTGRKTRMRCEFYISTQFQPPKDRRSVRRFGQIRRAVSEYPKGVAIIPPHTHTHSLTHTRTHNSTEKEKSTKWGFEYRITTCVNVP